MRSGQVNTGNDGGRYFGRRCNVGKAKKISCAGAISAGTPAASNGMEFLIEPVALALCSDRGLVMRRRLRLERAFTVVVDAVFFHVFALERHHPY